MKKSLFRLTDMLELSIAYIFCFSLNLLLDYAKTLDLDAYVLRACLKSFDKNGGVGDNRKKQAGAGENASIPK